MTGVEWPVPNVPICNRRPTGVRGQGEVAWYGPGTMDDELIGGNPPHRLRWGEAAGWIVQRETEPNEWADVATYTQTPPIVARPFAKWLAAQTGLTCDQAEDAVGWLRDQSPTRFIDPLDEPDGGGG